MASSDVQTFRSSDVHSSVQSQLDMARIQDPALPACRHALLMEYRSLTTISNRDRPSWYVERSISQNPVGRAQAGRRRSRSRTWLSRLKLSDPRRACDRACRLHQAIAPSGSTVTRHPNPHIRASGGDHGLSGPSLPPGCGHGRERQPVQANSRRPIISGL